MYCAEKFYCSPSILSVSFFPSQNRKQTEIGVRRIKYRLLKCSFLILRVSIGQGSVAVSLYSVPSHCSGRTGQAYFLWRIFAPVKFTARKTLPSSLHGADSFLLLRSQLKCHFLWGSLDLHIWSHHWLSQAGFFFLFILLISICSDLVPLFVFSFLVIPLC